MSNLDYSMSGLDLYRIATLEGLGSASHPHGNLETNDLPHCALVLALADRDASDVSEHSMTESPTTLSKLRRDADMHQSWPSWVPDFDRLPSSADDKSWWYLDYGRNKDRREPLHGPIAYRHDESRRNIFHLHVAYLGRIVSVSSAYSLLASISWNKSAEATGWAQTNAIIEISTDRLVGNVPSSAAAGDLLAVVGGAPQPFVFRSTDNDAYKLLGDASLDVPIGNFDAKLYWQEHEQVWITVI